MSGQHLPSARRLVPLPLSPPTCRDRSATRRLPTFSHLVREIVLQGHRPTIPSHLGKPPDQSFRIAVTAGTTHPTTTSSPPLGQTFGATCQRRPESVRPVRRRHDASCLEHRLALPLTRHHHDQQLRRRLRHWPQHLATLACPAELRTRPRSQRPKHLRCSSLSQVNYRNLAIRNVQSRKPSLLHSELRGRCTHARMAYISTSSPDRQTTKSPAR
jgi:hypothetical protein